MERGAWTNERLDGLALEMRTGFARVDQDIRDLRAEMHDGFKQLRGEISGLRVEFRVVMVGLIGVIAAVLARGA